MNVLLAAEHVVTEMARESHIYQITQELAHMQLSNIAVEIVNLSQRSNLLLSLSIKRWEKTSDFNQLKGVQ